VRNGLAAIGVHRICYGITTVCTLLLYRNYFHGNGFFRAGLAGLTQVVAMIAAGGALAAFVTPAAFRHLGPVRWPAAVMLGAAASQLAFVLPYSLPLALLAALVLGFVAQAVKISVDTLVQQHIRDTYRGRVFSLYDTLFNIALVVAALLTATVLPADGHAPASVIVIAAAYAATAVAYVVVDRRRISPVGRTTS
jgi:MFS family permease